MGSIVVSEINLPQINEQTSKFGPNSLKLTRLRTLGSRNWGSDLLCRRPASTMAARPSVAAAAAAAGSARLQGERSCWLARELRRPEAASDYVGQNLHLT